MIILKEKIHTVTEVAKLLGITTGRVRQICREKEIGQIIGKTRILTDKDIKEIESRPDRRKSDEKK